MAEATLPSFSMLCCIANVNTHIPTLIMATITTALNGKSRCVRRKKKIS